MTTPEIRLEWLLSLNRGKRNKQDAQNPMGEEPGLKGAAWILGREQRTDTMGVFTTTIGDGKGLEKGVVDTRY